MSDLKVLSVQKRAGLGKGANRRARQEELIPGVFYTAKGANLPVQMSTRAFVKLFSQVGRTTVFNLEIEGEGTHPVLIWATQRDPISSRFTHIDFYGVELDKPVKITVPVEFSGVARGTKVGGKLETYREQVVDAINNDKDGYFILTDDMTLDAMPNITDFGGTLDGDGHTIDMGTVGSVSSEQAGIFATTTGDAAIVNLNVKVESLEGDASEGGLIVGKVKDGTLTLDNVHASGSITATRYGDSNHMFGGGLVGFVPMGAVLEAANCSFTGSVSTNMTALIDANAYNCYVGGIVGAIVMPMMQIYQMAG